MKASPEYPGGYGLDEEMSLKDWLHILLDEWKLLLVPVILSVLIGGTYLLTRIPTYQAEGILQVTSEQAGPSGALLEFSGMTVVSPTESEVEILRSRRVLGEAARHLNLHLQRPMSSYTLDMGVSLGHQSPICSNLVRLRKSLSRFRVEDGVIEEHQAVFAEDANGMLQITMNGYTARLKPGEAFSRDGVSFRYDGHDGSSRIAPMEVRILPELRLVSSLRENLSVRTIGDRKETNLVQVAFVHPDRRTAAAVVNAVMDAYMAFALESRTDRAEKSATFIEQQMESLRSSLEETERNLQEFLESSGTVLLSEQAKVLIHDSSQMNMELQKLRMQETLMKQVASQLDRQQGKDGTIALTGDFIVDDELLSRAVGTLNDLMIQKETLLADHTPKHPHILRTNEEVHRVREQIRQYVRASLTRITQRRRSLDTSIETLQDEMSRFPEKERTLASLRRNQEVGQQLYTFLLTKLEETRIVRASTTTDKRMIDAAAIPIDRFSPRRRPMALIALFLGIVLGVLFIFVKRTLDPKVQDEDEAKSLTQLPVLGVIPNLKTLGIVFDGPGIHQKIWESPKGPAAEAFRTLRTNVEFSQTPEYPIRVIQITSSEAGEGKSTVMSNLAISLAKAGNRVILADLDLRRPMQHQIWDIPRSAGISDHLSGRETLRPLHIDAYGLDVVPAGYEPPDSQRLLSSVALSQLVETWRQQYDYVLLDTPPLLVTDALVISKLSDLMLFVVRPRVCRRTALRLAGHTWSRMELVKGLVVNGKATRRGGYYHYYRGSYYGSRTSDTQEK